MVTRIAVVPSTTRADDHVRSVHALSSAGGGKQAVELKTVILTPASIRPVKFAAVEAAASVAVAAAAMAFS
eukprot:scaffold74742_cov29-Tisochrysis_lutea.AAC.5